MSAWARGGRQDFNFTFFCQFARPISLISNFSAQKIRGGEEMQNWKFIVVGLRVVPLMQEYTAIKLWGDRKYFKSTLFCGVTFSLLPTFLSLIKVKMQSPKEIEVVTNLIATALYRDRTDLQPILTFSDTAFCIQLHSWSKQEMHTTIG